MSIPFTWSVARRLTAIAAHRRHEPPSPWSSAWPCWGRPACRRHPRAAPRPRRRVPHVSAIDGRVGHRDQGTALKASSRGADVRRAGCSRRSTAGRGHGEGRSCAGLETTPSTSAPRRCAAIDAARGRLDEYQSRTMQPDGGGTTAAAPTTDRSSTRGCRPQHEAAPTMPSRPRRPRRTRSPPRLATVRARSSLAGLAP